MSNTKKKKTEQLGMNPSTAQQRLKKMILFEFTKKLNLDICHQCNDKIVRIENFSVEHKIPWLDSDDPVGLFFDLDNVAFSHLKCNVGAARQTKVRKHPSHSAYRRGCRCDECRELAKLRIYNQRARGIVKGYDPENYKEYL